MLVNEKAPSRNLLSRRCLVYQRISEHDSFIDEILPSDEPQIIDCAFSQSFLDYVLPNGVA